jgi:hypothetical protein
VAVSKYNDGLPLYRQILERDGIHLDRATLDGAWWLKPLWELLLGSVLSSPKLFCDDTRLPVLAPGKGRTGYLWGIARQPLAGRPAAGVRLYRGPGPRGAGRLHRRIAGRRLGRLQAADRQTEHRPG